MDRLLDRILLYLNKGGAHERRWLAEGQRPIQMIVDAITEVLETSEVDKEDVELVIHAGLGRAFIEAGQSYFVTQAMKMYRAHCFDVMDASNSWSRAMLIAYGLIRSGLYKRILIVNTECNMIEGGISNPVCFSYNTFSDVKYKFAGMTLADGVSATLLVQDTSNENWSFQFSSRSDLADLCAVPLSGYEQFVLPSEYLAKNGVNKFTSFALPMNEQGKEECFQLLKTLKLGKMKLIFAHGHQKLLWENLLKRIGDDPNKVRWNSYEKIGNIASACIPVCMKMAETAGELQRGDYISTLMGSGGMSFSTIAFHY